MRPILIFVSFVFLLLTAVNPVPAPASLKGDRVLSLIEKMQAAFKEVKDYTCEVDQVFYEGGAESQRYRFKYYFKREKRIRVDFYHPYPTLSLFYDGGKEVVVVPFRAMGLLKFHLSIDHPKIQTLAGQKINQTDMGYFIDFLSENLKEIPQEGEEFEEDGDQVKFWFRALDYIQGKKIERYRIFVAKENWLPLRIERYSLEMKPLELTIIKNYTTNTHLEDKLFVP
jgi:outer membrane lipoprotein-sorting protein